MEKWLDIKKIVDYKNKDEKNVLKGIGKIVSEWFTSKSNSEKTKLIKLTLINLGHKSCYKVYANGLTEKEVKKVNHNFVNIEWMFDIHWYTEPEKTDYQIKEMKLVAECEWENKCRFKKDDCNRKEKISIPYSAVKYDFQKLLITNCEIRLLIFKLTKEKYIKELDQYFESAIENCKSTDKDARFLCIAFYQREQACYYRFIQK